MSCLCRPSSDLSDVVLITLSIFSVSKPFLPSSYPLSRIFQRVPTWMALYSLIVLMCRYESAHSLTSRWFQVSFSCTRFCHRLVQPLCVHVLMNEWIFKSHVNCHMALFTVRPCIASRSTSHCWSLWAQSVNDCILCFQHFPKVRPSPTVYRRLL